MEREFPLAPLVGVGAVVVEQGRVLLVRRGTEPLKGQWSLPGGMLELGESLTGGVMREVREETGLIVETVELVELLDRIQRDGERVRYHYVLADYLCRVVGGLCRLPPTRMRCAGWSVRSGIGKIRLRAPSNWIR